jgi:hypothetical protein
MEPGLDRHEWEAEMSALEEDLATGPDEALPERGSEEISAGDVGAAVNGFRAVFQAVVSAHDRAS